MVERRVAWIILVIFVNFCEKIPGFLRSNFKGYELRLYRAVVVSSETLPSDYGHKTDALQPEFGS